MLKTPLVVDLSLHSLQRILEAHQLARHRIRTSILPPMRSSSRSMRREPNPALDRTQPGLPMKPGRPGDHDARLQTSRHHDAVRSSQHLRQNCHRPQLQRHRHQDFIRLLNTIEELVQVGKMIDAIVDNYATHRHPKVHHWLALNPR